ALVRCAAAGLVPIASLTDYLSAKGKPRLSRAAQRSSSDRRPHRSNHSLRIPPVTALQFERRHGLELPPVWRAQLGGVPSSISLRRIVFVSFHWAKRMPRNRRRICLSVVRAIPPTQFATPK